MNTNDWTFPTLAYVWEYRNGAIVAGGEKLDSLTEDERDRSLAELHACVRAMVDQLDDGWLVMTAFWMVEDIFKSFFGDFVWTPGVHDYIAATALPVIAEFRRRGMVLNYVIDGTQGTANLAAILTYLPEVFEAAGLDVVGPQLIAAKLFGKYEERTPADMTEIQRYRDEGHDLADRIVSEWHKQRRSCVYLNMDFNDDTPALSLDVAVSQRGTPGTAVIFRSEPPVEGSRAQLFPPPGITVPEASGRADSPAPDRVSE